MKLLFLSIILISVNLFAQNGIIRNKYPNGKPMYEFSFVNDVLEGTSYWYYNNGYLSKQVTFNNGIVNGTVKTFYKNGLLKEEYSVQNGIRDGLYRSFHNNGGLNEFGVFKNGELVKKTIVDFDSLFNASPEQYNAGKRPFDSKSYTEYICSVDICPEPAGGMDAIYEKLEYPEHAKLYGLEGIVQLNATVDTLGNVLSTKIYKSLGLGCDEAADIAVKSVRFVPGFDKNKKVQSDVVLTIKFEIPKYNQIALDELIRKREQNLMSLNLSDNETMNNISDELYKNDTTNSSVSIKNFDCKYPVCPKPKNGISEILGKLEIPEYLLSKSSETDVILEVLVSNNGFPLDVKFIKGSTKSINSAIERAILKTEFSPAISDGKEVESSVRIILPLIKIK